MECFYYMSLTLILICTTILISVIFIYFTVRKVCEVFISKYQTTLELRMTDMDIIKNLEMDRVLVYLTLEKYRNSKPSLLHIEKPEVNLLPKNK